jgi:serine protease Do
VGEPATLTVIRDGKERKIEVVLGELDKFAGVTSKYGLKVEPMQEKSLSRQNLRYGLKVVEVDSESPFAGAIEPGDILLEINRRPLRSETDLSQTLDAAPKGRPVAIRLLRRGQPLFLAVDLD